MRGGSSHWARGKTACSSQEKVGRVSKLHLSTRHQIYRFANSRSVVDVRVRGSRARGGGAQGCAFVGWWAPKNSLKHINCLVAHTMAFPAPSRHTTTEIGPVIASPVATVNVTGTLGVVPVFGRDRGHVRNAAAAADAHISCRVDSVDISFSDFLEIPSPTSSIISAVRRFGPAPDG